MSTNKFRTKLLITIIGLLLSIQCTSSIPVSNDIKAYQDDSSLCKKTIPKEHFEKYEKLSVFTLEELGAYKNSTLNLLKRFFDKIVQDGSRDESLKNELEPFKRISKEFTEEEKTNSTFDEFATEEKANDLLKQYNLTSSKGEQSKKEVDLIADILEKFGWHNLINQTYEAGNKAVKNFATKVEEYRHSLTSEERANDKTFDDWYAKLNAEKDHCKVIQLFEEFFELYCSADAKRPIKV